MKLNESINDKNLFKAVFMAGGPGSGKSFIARHTFGFGKDNISFSGAMLVNSDILFETGLKNAGLPMTIDLDDEEIYKKQMVVRDRAKELTDTRKSFWIDSMLPLVIDGTGKNFEKIKHQSETLKSIGYDTYMVFVNTSLETAQRRNEQRTRSIDPSIVEQMWKMVQFNMGRFQSYFTPENFRVVDNNEEFERGSMESKKFEDYLYRLGKSILYSPLKNRLGIMNIQYLKEHGGKYLSDLAQEEPLVKN